MVCFIYICVIWLNVQIDVYIDIYILVSNVYIYILWLFNQVMQRIAQNLGSNLLPPLSHWLIENDTDMLQLLWQNILYTTHPNHLYPEDSHRQTYM